MYGVCMQNLTLKLIGFNLRILNIYSFYIKHLIMKQIAKSLTLLLFLLFLGTAFYSCQKDDICQENEPLAEDFLTPMPTKTAEGDFDIVPQIEKSSTLKSTTDLYDSEFIDGGMAMIAGQFMPTVIVGDQRWTTVDFKGHIQNASLTNLENSIYGDATDPNSTNYYSYNLAMTLNGSPTMMNYNAPAGLAELSNWRIPSWSDENHLGYMSGGDNAKVNTNLDFKPTGVIYHEYTTSPINPDSVRAVFYNAHMATHWNSEFISGTGTGNGPYGTWHLTGGNCVDYIYLFQFQYMSPHAPIRLVQDIEPIQ